LLLSSQKKLILSCDITPPTPAKRTDPIVNAEIVIPPTIVRTSVIESYASPASLVNALVLDQTATLPATPDPVNPEPPTCVHPVDPSLLAYNVLLVISHHIVDSAADIDGTPDPVNIIANGPETSGNTYALGDVNAPVDNVAVLVESESNIKSDLTLKFVTVSREVPSSQ
jgi:hypothetical protein